MSKATKAQYRRAARLYHSGLSQAEAVVKAGVYSNIVTAKKCCHNIFKPETGNQYLLDELERLRKVEFDEAVLSKKEKLETNARLSRKLADKLDESLDSEDGEIDHKAIDSYVKLGKRDDVLQGHQIQAETNPQDKKDQMIADWFMEVQRQNEEKRMKDADVIDV
jgi:hypothetical protein